MDPSILPAELWDAIFSDCGNTPLCLSQICSHLRKTVHANCKLWSVIRIKLYKRGLRGDFDPLDNCSYISCVQADRITQSLRLTRTHPITLIFDSGVISTDYPPDAFELTEQSSVFPLMRCGLGRCREFKMEATAAKTFNDTLSNLVRGIALPVLRDVSLYGSGWYGGGALELLFTGARNIRRIYVSGDVLDLHLAHFDWAHTIHEFKLGQDWPRWPGDSISAQFPNISNLSIGAETMFDCRLQDHIGLRKVLSALRLLTSFSVFMNYDSRQQVLEALKLADVAIPTLEELSIVYIDPGVHYPVAESVFVHLIHRASLKTLRLLGIPIRSAGLLNLLQPVQSTLRVLIISEPIATIDPYCPLSPAFFYQMHDKSFLPNLTSLHLVWNHVVDEKCVVDMLEQRAFGAVSVGRGVPFEGMEEEVKRRVSQLNITYPPLLRVPYGSERP
ncbi:hypothetical protein CPB85DRAFT_1313730 [Mucidula mucida]|nr:hypothetical protein CPB85DRAFT_1313730 [Mucidula mucida]